MFRHYTRKQLSNLSLSPMYLLPDTILHKDQTDEEILHNTVKWFQSIDPHQGQGEIRRVSINKYNKIVLQCIYQGYEEHYPFRVVVDVIRFREDPTDSHKKKNTLLDGTPILLMEIEQEEHPLLEELLEDKFRQPFMEAATLIKYHCF